MLYLTTTWNTAEYCIVYAHIWTYAAIHSPYTEIYGTRFSCITLKEIQQKSDFLFPEKLIFRIESNATDIIFGSTNEFEILMDVTNLGEAAYSAIMKLNFSSDFNVGRVTIDGVSVL